MFENRECESCRRVRQVGVACYPYGAISFAYCIECLKNNAHPKFALRCTMIECGGLDKMFDGFGEDNYYFEPKDETYHQAKELEPTQEEIEKFWQDYQEACDKLPEPTGDTI